MKTTKTFSVLIWINASRAKNNQADFPLSNSMSESTHSIYKTEFLKGHILRTVKNHLDNLKKRFNDRFFYA